MATVTVAAINEEIWNNFYSLISGLTDPASRTGSPKWIVSSFPDTDIDTIGYPIVEISSPNVEFSKFTFRKKNVYSCKIRITVHTKKAAYADQLADDIIAIFNSSTNLNTLYAANIVRLEMSGSDYTTVIRNGNKIHEKSLTYSFRFYGSVS